MKLKTSVFQRKVADGCLICSFKLKRGEILGIYGLMGAGRTEVFECLMGLHPEHTGEVYVDGKKIKIKNIAEQINEWFCP